MTNGLHTEIFKFLLENYCFDLRSRSTEVAIILSSRDWLMCESVVEINKNDGNSKVQILETWRVEKCEHFATFARALRPSFSAPPTRLRSAIPVMRRYPLFNFNYAEYYSSVLIRHSVESLNFYVFCFFTAFYQSSSPQLLPWS